MRAIIYKNAFKKQHKLMKLRGKDEHKLQKIVLTLAENLPLAPSYRDHALTGELIGCRELHIEPDWLLVYRKTDPSQDYPAGVLFLELTGTHADLF